MQDAHQYSEVFSMALNNEELLLYTYLRKNARMKLTKISRRTGIPVSTLHEKITKKFPDFIKKYTVIPELDKLGFAARAFLILRVKKELRKEIRDYFMKCHNVNSLFKINNTYDFLIDVIFRDMKGLESFLEKLDERFGVLERNIFYIIDEMKCETFLNNPALLTVSENGEIITYTSENTKFFKIPQREQRDEKHDRQDETQHTAGNEQRND